MLLIKVSNEKQNQQLIHLSGPIELGRGDKRALPRLVIDDAFVSRDQLGVEELPNNRVRLTNLSTKHPIALRDGTRIAAQGHLEVPLPVFLMVGTTLIEIEAQNPVAGPHSIVPSTPGPEMKRLIADKGYQTIRPVHADDAPMTVALFDPEISAPSLERLATWMETILALQRSNATPAEFYAQTAERLVQMIGLDVGLVLFHTDRKWRVVARSARDNDEASSEGPFTREFSQTILNQVLVNKQTFYQDLGLMKSQESLINIDAVVVSPIFGLNETVVGALYGLRRSHGRLQCKITSLEAQLVQLMAAAVGANYTRTLATKTRTQFEQFFSPELVRELERDPGLLEGREITVTILITDLRRFSSISERLGPQQTCQLVRDVMERLSERVSESGGVIVSYLGDGLLAMWNAPTRQPDHAANACRAALAMQRDLPALNAIWEPIVGHPLQLGIGINTGPAQVGNTGSSRKFMYGPLGNTVNLASRVESATKALGVPIIVTGSTRNEIGDALPTRRLGQVRVVGIREPVHLYELHDELASSEWLAFRDAYETALGQYESGQWLAACQTLLPLMQTPAIQTAGDPAILKLVKRAWACLEEQPDPFDPVLDLAQK